jgi:hypothetical protein
MIKFRPVVLTAEVVGILAVVFFISATPSQAKECHAERPANARTYWSYRLIDGRKCWYEGRPMISKSLLHWPASRTAQASARPEPAVAPAVRYKMMDAQASISDDPELKSKSQAKPEAVDTGPAPAPKGTLTPDDLRAWGSTMAAMTADPILTILDRWPDAELPQHRNKPATAAATQASAMNARSILMVIIILMALSAVLMKAFRKVGARRGGRPPLLAMDLRWRGLEFKPDQLPKGSPLLMDMRSEMPLRFSSDPIPMYLESRAGSPA